MVKRANSESRVAHRVRSTAVVVLTLLAASYCLLPAIAQQPQAPANEPLYSVNAKYVNGVAPGYWPTAGSGLTLNLSAGTAFCGNPPGPVSYAGGTLTMTASATNYVYLDPANSCAPAASTSSFAVGQIPIATVVAGASSITTITDARTWFMPNATTATAAGLGVTAALTDKGGQVFNVKAYGAKGDGTTDDSAAFQSAINAAAAVHGTVYIPHSPGNCYLIDTALNLTASGDVGLEGEHKDGSTICGNTGGIVFDVSSQSGIHFTNLNVKTSGMTNPSLVGIYAARNSSDTGTQDLEVVDCTFTMPLHTSGTTYSFGAYLYGSEINFFTRDYFIADYPLAVMATNDFSINSAYITEATGTVSEDGDFFTDMELDSSGLGPAAYFSGTSNMTLTGHSWNFNYGPSYSSSLFQYALEFVNSNRAMHINWRQEGYPGFLSNSLNLFNSTLQGSTAPGTTPSLHAVEFYDASSQILNDTFRIVDEYTSPSSNYYYDSTAGATTGVMALDTVNFYCGNEPNCIDIPVGNYSVGGYTPYNANVQYSSSPTNLNPAITIGGSTQFQRFSNAFSFSPPTATVAANTCTAGTTVTNAQVTLSSTIVLSNTNWYNLLPTVTTGTGHFTFQFCNPTSGSITPGAGTMYYRLLN